MIISFVLYCIDETNDASRVLAFIGLDLFVLSLVIGMWGWGLREIAFEKASKSWVNNYELKIYSINDKFDTRNNYGGSFFLGSGSVSGGASENHRYYYISKGEFGGYEIGKINSNICEVVEYSGDPKLIIYKKAITDEFVLKKLPRDKYKQEYKEAENERKYVFYIPKGSITVLDYNIDLK